MATADIAKQAVFDARVVQNAPRYAVQKGGLSLTNAPYRAISATTAQHTYQINVPSQNVFCDRAIQWSSGVSITFVATVVGGPADAANNINIPVCVYGRDFALTAFPLNYLIGTTTATINDTSVTINTESVFSELLRLTDYKKNRISRTCPTMLDTVARYASVPLSVVSPLASFEDQTDHANQPNGAWGAWEWADPNNGNKLVGNGTYTPPGGGAGDAVPYQNGIPGFRAANSDARPYVLCINFFSTEKLLLSPFIFADAAEWETGIFGVNNIQLVLNMKADIGRVLRNCPVAGPTGRTVTLSAVQYRASANGNPFINPSVNVQYITPSLDLPLPAKSVVQYMEFPRYLQALTNVTIAAGSKLTGHQSNTIVLPQIPDALLIYCKPAQNTLTPADADFYLPITRISINFDNFAGILSSHTREQLYEMSVHNGLDMDYNTWSGLAARRAAPTAAGAAVPPSSRLQTVGGFLILKPGLDITLQAGQAPGLIGNFTLQYTVDIENTGATDVVSPVLYTVAVNSGFFETLAGSSRIVKGVLSEADILSAEPAPEVTHEGLERMVGHGFMDKLGSFLSKAKDVYSATKPAVSALKGALPEGMVKSALGAVGYGRAGGGLSGGDAAGAGKKSLSARLM